MQAKSASLLGSLRVGVRNHPRWHSAKRVGEKWACPNKAMAHTWFMHDVGADFWEGM